MHLRVYKTLIKLTQPSQFSAKLTSCAQYISSQLEQACNFNRTQAYNFNFSISTGMSAQQDATNTHQVLCIATQFEGPVIIEPTILTTVLLTGENLPTVSGTTSSCSVTGSGT